MNHTKTKLLALFVTTVTAATLQAQTTPGPQPSICNRACWSARSGSCSTALGSLTRAIVHHTAGPSDYTTNYETGKARMRANQNYHMDSNGWCDIGYHFLVNAAGHIYEGRAGSIGASGSWKKGAHDGCNANSMGFTALGYYHTPYNHTFTQALQDGLAAVIAWRMPSGWSATGSGTYCSNTVGTLDGHYKVKSTACPGTNIINGLGALRNNVSARRTSAVNNASVVSMSYPSSVVKGQSFSATVTMHNNGTTHWVNANGYNLGSQNPQDNTRWGLGRVGFAGTISPGQSHAFTFTCTAPSTAGTYAFDWKMVQDGVQWFGATAVGTIIVNEPSNAVIVDNQAASYTGSGWVVGTSAPDKYGSDYRYRSTAPVSEPATFTANLPAGSRNVYAWWSAGSNRSATAPYIVYHSGGSTTVQKNQQANGGSWQLLGNFNFNAGNNDVKLSCWTTTGYVVIADAVKWGD